MNICLVWHILYTFLMYNKKLNDKFDFKIKSQLYREVIYVDNNKPIMVKY